MSVSFQLDLWYEELFQGILCLSSGQDFVLSRQSSIPGQGAKTVWKKKKKKPDNIDQEKKWRYH